MKDFLQSETAVFAFNIWDINSAKAIIDAAHLKNKTIILQTSAGIYRGLPKKQFREFISGYSKEAGVDVYLQLDHCKDYEVIKDAVDHKWDIVMIDASDRRLEENIRITNQTAEYAHCHDVFVEAEIGQVKGAEDDIRTVQEKIASKADIERFLKETETDWIAAAFGNAHGIYHGTPDLHYELIDYIGRITEKPFVVHGGSGLTDDILKKLLTYSNVRKINISTDVKLAYRMGLLNAYNAGVLNKSGFQAAVVENYIQEEIKNMAETKLKLLDKGQNNGLHYGHKYGT